MADVMQDAIQQFLTGSDLSMVNMKDGKIEFQFSDRQGIDYKFAFTKEEIKNFVKLKLKKRL